MRSPALGAVRLWAPQRGQGASRRTLLTMPDQPQSPQRWLA